ncbi:MAG: regulatory protein RecX [Dehalococcoidia bacterium]|nr:regulatory protein RecX [Dehalococcoidia bacterium]
MIITTIEPTSRRRGRVDVWLDGVSRIELARDLVAGVMRAGDEVDGATVAALVERDARQQAMRLAASMLARRARSEHEVRRRLMQRRFEPDLVDETIARLRQAGLLDDGAFARSWCEARLESSPRGGRLLGEELRARGVTGEVAASAVASVSDDDAAYRAAVRRARSLRRLDYAMFRARLSGFLQRRGFGWSVASATVERCWGEFGSGERDDAARVTGA